MWFDPKNVDYCGPLSTLYLWYIEIVKFKRQIQKVLWSLFKEVLVLTFFYFVSGPVDEQGSFGTRFEDQIQLTLH